MPSLLINNPKIACASSEPAQTHTAAKIVQRKLWQLHARRCQQIMIETNGARPLINEKLCEVSAGGRISVSNGNMAPLGLSPQCIVEYMSRKKYNSFDIHRSMFGGERQREREVEVDSGDWCDIHSILFHLPTLPALRFTVCVCGVDKVSSSPSETCGSFND